jgi:hypothetical protein
MTRIVCIVAIVFFSLLASLSFALEAMPYTNEAVNSLNRAIDRFGAPDKDIQGDTSLKVKTYVETYRKIFASAGYDYERSIMKIINDIQFERYRLNSATITLNGLARELLRLHVKSEIHPKTYLSKECAELLIEFRDLIRSNMKKYGGC